MPPILSGIDISHLWDGSILRLPQRFKDCYRTKLIELNLLDRASAGETGDGPYGGISDEATLEHFARRFGVSGCRIQSVAIGVNSALATASADILSALCDGGIRILDIPCGAGAASLSLLSLLGEIRQHGELPRLPLSIDIVGGDYSPKALELFISNLDYLSQKLTLQGMHISSRAIAWDATRGDSTANLMNAVLDESTTIPDEYCVLISNFSGDAGYKEFFVNFSPCLEQILARLHSKKVTLVWVEPVSKTGHWLADFLAIFLGNRTPWISAALGITNVDASYRVEHPIRLDSHNSGVKLVRHFRR